MTRITLILSYFIACALFFSGCATAPRTESPITAASPEVTASAEPSFLKASDMQPFADRTQWPEMPKSIEDAPVYNIKSGVDDNGVWTEGKGYFRGSLEKIYESLIDPKIMGPTYLTKDIVVDKFESTPIQTTFVMHIKMRYIMSVEFDLGIVIDTLHGEDSQTVGYRYRSSKKSGTKFITRIDEQIVINELEGGWFSVEFRSLNEATMNKEKETRKHIENLFSHWESWNQEISE